MITDVLGSEQQEALGWERLNAVRVMQGDAVHALLVGDLLIAVRSETRRDVSARLVAALVGALPLDEWLKGVGYAISSEAVTLGS